MTFKPGSSDADIQRVVSRFGTGKRMDGSPSEIWYQVKITNGMSPQEAVNKASRDPAVAWAAVFGKNPNEGVFMEAHKVLVTMKDGSKVSGYVFWGFYNEGQFPFEPKKFLEYFRKHDHLDSFELYRTFSRVNDGGGFGGYAESEEDKLEIPAGSVAGLESTPDELEGTRLDHLFILHKEQIQVMQGRFRFEEDASDGEKYYYALNYDPRVSKKKLRQLLQKFRRDMDKNENNWEWDRTAKPWKVVLMFVDMTDD